MGKSIYFSNDEIALLRYLSSNVDFGNMLDNDDLELLEKIRRKTNEKVDFNDFTWFAPGTAQERWDERTKKP